MDEKILAALNNISDAIEEIAKHSRKKTENSSKSILQSVDLGKKMEDIKKGIISIKKDTEKILKNQETLLNISKEKSNNSVFNTASDKASKIKSGVSTVLLIAAGVLAIGIAFKLIGQVDFFSVIALSITLPLVAIAFERIAELKGLKGADLKNILFSVVTMSTAVMLSSWVLSAVHPISIAQAATTILIGGTFALLGFSIEKIAKGIRTIKPSDLLMMPLVLFTMSLSITLSSQILRGIHPISIAQGITAILIGGTFAMLALSIEKIANGIKNVKTSDMLKMPLVLIAMSFSITLSSWILRLITPMSVAQGITAIAIAATLALVSLSLPALAYAVKNTSIKDAFLMTAILPLLSLAIAVSSWVLQLVVPVDNLGQLVLFSIALGISAIAMGGTIWLISKMGLGLRQIIEGSLAVLALATTIMLSSWILSIGKYDKYPTLEWAAGVGLSLVAFGLSAVVLGAISMSGIGALALLAGGAAVLLLSGVIVATSFILGTGNYANYPTLAWSSGVALSLTAFGLGTMLLGSFIIGSFGLGLGVLAAGAIGVAVISEAIVKASDILGKGNYTGGPTKEWAEGISLALGAFAPVFNTLFDRGIIGLFSKGPSVDDFTNAITSVSQGIVTAGKFFMSVPDIWKGGPTAEWAAGVGGALTAFAPVFDALSKSSGLFGSGPTPDEMVSAMIKISGAIVSVGMFFAKSPGVWTKAPSAEWAAGVSGAISAFGPIFDFFEKNKDNGWFDNTFENLNESILIVARSIVEVDKIISKGSFTNTIPSGYIQSMSDNIKAYLDLINYLQNKDIGALSFVSSIGAVYGLSKLATSYDRLSNSVKKLSSAINGIDSEKLNSLRSLNGSVILMSLMDSDQFSKMMDALESKGGIYIKLMEELNELSEKREKSYGTLNTIKSSSEQKGATTDDLLGALLSINSNVKTLVKNSNNFVSYIDELRGSSNSIKPKNHF